MNFSKASSSFSPSASISFCISCRSVTIRRIGFSFSRRPKASTELMQLAKRIDIKKDIVKIGPRISQQTLEPAIRMTPYSNTAPKAPRAASTKGAG